MNSRVFQNNVVAFEVDEAGDEAHCVEMWQVLTRESELYSLFTNLVTMARSAFCCLIYFHCLINTG